MWETYSSFANSNGGTILLGVEEVGKEKPNFNIIGVSNAAKMIKEIWDVMNSDNVSCNILTDDDIKKEPIDDKEIIVIKYIVQTANNAPIIYQR